MTHEYINHIEQHSNISYDRPIFLLPPLHSPEGNTFVLFGLFLKNLDEAGYNNEKSFIIKNFVAQQFGDLIIPSNTGFSRNDVYGFVELMDQFCSLEESNIVEENEDYIITKTPKNGKNLRNPIFFEKAKLSIAKSMLEEKDTKEHLLETNVYGRNILHYLPLSDALSLAKSDKDLLATALNEDVFGQTFFSYKINLTNFKDVCEFLSKDLSLSSEEITDIFSTKDAFNNETIDYLLKDMDKEFPLLQKLSKRLEENYSFSSLADVNINPELFIYVNIVNCTYLLLKHDSYLGEKLHNSLFNEKSPEYKKIGSYFAQALKTVEKKINKEETHPSFLNFLNTVNELRLRKTLDAFDERNPQVNESKVVRERKKL